MRILISRYFASVLLAVFALCALSLRCFANPSPTISNFLRSHALGALYLHVGHQKVPQYNGFFIRTTNAQLTGSEATRWDSPLREGTGEAIDPTGDEPSQDINGLVSRDAKQHLLAIVQGPKNWGGYRYILTEYDGTAPESIPKTDLSALSVAGLKIGDSANSVFLRFGEPYRITKLIADKRVDSSIPHVLGRPSWFTTDLGDGVYEYTGAVPNKAQSCVTLYELVIEKQRLRAILASTEC